MAAFWQWKVAEELEFPAECIVFEDGDVPETATADSATLADNQILGSEVAGLGRSTQQSGAGHLQTVPEMEREDSAESVGTKSSGLGAIASAGPGIFDSEDSVNLMNGGRASRAQLKEPVSRSQGQANGSKSRTWDEDAIQTTKQHGSSGDQGGRGYDVSNEHGAEAHRPNGDASTSKQQKGLRFVGEAAKSRPAYKYLVDVKVHHKSGPQAENGHRHPDAQSSDEDSSDTGSNAVPLLRRSEESSNRPRESPTSPLMLESLSVQSTEVVVQSVVQTGGPNRSEDASASLEGWRLEPSREAAAGLGGRENGDVSDFGAEARPEESNSESVLSPFREESTTTVVLNSTGTSTLMTGETSAAQMDGRGREAAAAAEPSVREEAAGSSCKPGTNPPLNPPHRHSNLAAQPVTSSGQSSANTAVRGTEPPLRDEGEASASKAGSHLSALEEYLARSEECEEAPEALSAVEAATAMREAVRRMREDAALLALRLSALYASDASNLRQTAQSMVQHVVGAQAEVQEMRSGLVAIESQRLSVRNLLSDGLLSALVFAVLSEWPRFQASVIHWLGGLRSPGVSLSWPWRSKPNLVHPLPPRLPPKRWPWSWSLLVAVAFFGYKRLVTSLRQEQARRAMVRSLLGKWTQIAERLVIMGAIAERGLARTEVAGEEATRP
ncbi:hypothetical protein KFL_001020210 [Klebsormidium nitens]|uniref:Uncharacterized protein n=1 Tax=Klebsormidium nitens TaxID=105231 RepID=A0A1Y1HZ06_KLENI|nr:hypothetical protein KFL_001020210 [Klebsormidium nitens]|eukprot:GAQ82171.1 hypothetical protein KFL_001020210 [Klebsormidium nitens]